MTEAKVLQTEKKLPKPFILRRLHSLFGAWLVLYLFWHLLVNSQAALFFKDEGSHFVALVNKLEDLPFLQVVELLFIGLPFVIHIVWGVLYLRQAKMNSFPSDGSKPALPEYRRNRAYSWQRITSWILIVGVVAHVVHMRFLNAPQLRHEGAYIVTVTDDAKLKNVAEKLRVTLEPNGKKIRAIADTPGKAFFLMVRESFKSPFMVVLYSLFVIFSCYHAFNGLWTFLITWGIMMTRRAQIVIRRCTLTLMWVTIFLGLLSAWGTYITYVS